ncbi:hypothetical protein ABIB62_001421 [Mucilaginibacter sp. UYP25]|uniref:hypothetical protein n=1 Tax=unclassified Mucilaginibacter TaxID=2617802 RepID=UPI0033993922
MKKILALLTLLIIQTASYAQITNPCGGLDEDDVCPLDTWVYVLVFAFMMFGAYKMYQKQKALTV